MRKAVAMMVAATLTCGSIAQAIEMRSELTVGREFVFLTDDVETEVLDGQLALGAGVTMTSDYTIERYGAQALVEYRGEHVNAGVAATFGPRQAERGWSSLDPHAEVRIDIGRSALRLDGGVLLRRIDAQARRAQIRVDQLQLHGELEWSFAERWRLAAFVLYSFYDPNPSAAALREIDLGLAVSLAGGPERWALGGRGARRIRRWLWLELGAGGVVYADGRGAALVPRAALRAGAWRGFSIATSFEVVVGLEGAAANSLREIGGLELELER